jgi:hypothetical protein
MTKCGMMWFATRRHLPISLFSGYEPDSQSPRMPIYRDLRLDARARFRPLDGVSDGSPVGVHSPALSCCTGCLGVLKRLTALPIARFSVSRQCRK